MGKIRREVQLHIACTIFPDRHGITRESTKENEICQFAAAFKPEQFGSIPISAVDKIFEEFKYSVVKKMREHGILRAGH